MSKHRPFVAVYIMASRPFGTLYTGVTSNLPYRVTEHREHLLGGFTAKYGCHFLVWYEQHELVVDAIRREKAIKRWRRRWKFELIEALNPGWRVLAGEVLAG